MASAAAPVMAAMAVAFVLGVGNGRWVIGVLRRAGVGQHVRDDGPQSHLAKEGTPTMGGVLIILATLAAAVVAAAWIGASWRVIALLLAITLGYGAIGAADDWRMIRKGRSLGLRARDKLLWQALVAAGFVAGLAALHPGHRSIGFPHVESLAIPLSWAYYPVMLVVIVGTSNAVNLTDGLDGLAAGLACLAAASFGAIALWSAQPTVAAFSFALSAACLGFMWFNFHPAQVFMGDTGALAIGAALAAIASVLRAELLLVPFCFMFYVEVLSVAVQVISFRLTGKRVLRMSPLHHHFELVGVAEPRIVAGFWTVALVLSGLGIYAVWRMWIA
jgi:phospho-N-acetylmuramoyl-pentapeptide-transferase